MLPQQLTRGSPLGVRRRKVRVRDLAVFGRPVVVVVWAKRIWRCPDRDYVTGLADLDRRILLDVAIGRSGKVVTDWLEAQALTWRSIIQVAAIDAFRGYATGIGACLDAELDLDRFRVVCLANQAVDDVRRRTQQETVGHRGRKGDPLYGIRRLLLVAGENLDQRGWDRLQRGLDAGDRWGEVSAALLAKELLRDVFSVRRHRARPPTPDRVLPVVRETRGTREPPTNPGRFTSCSPPATASVSPKPPPARG